MAQGGLTAALLPAAVEEVGKSEAMADVEERATPLGAPNLWPAATQGRAKGECDRLPHSEDGPEA